ncbi:hypothetical protein [Hyphomicrobium sp. D-2]|uniref:hypothetical protein n=1 Tax=Hyphomicrobium sp. D-2 TaxID=3041621 RepID=UPI002453FAB5|nr:hypothetical protein [Hyphomicrobium sp. D-2]MDH4982001.1 hypothetical protein [Hyphomicrobium sp. D-2]
MAQSISNGTDKTCCNVCKGVDSARPSFVVGVFFQPAAAASVAERLRRCAARNVDVVSAAEAIPDGPLTGLPGLGCGRLSEQISRHLQSGAALVVVNVQNPEQRLDISREMLDCKCDLLLTHDGIRSD